MESIVKGVWVLAEQRQGQVEDISLEALSSGRELADGIAEEVHAVVVGSNNEKLAQILASYGAKKVYFLDNPLLSEYSPGLYVEALSKLFEDERPRIVICGASLIGRDLTPRLAARLKTGLVSECVSLAINEEGLLLQTKLTHGGKVASTIVCPASKPQIATLKPGVTEKRKPDITKKTEVIVISPQLNRREPRRRVKGFLKADPEKIGLDEAETVIAGGRGLGSAENFQLLNELAKSLGGAVAGSLGAVDEGWISRKKLVGQTGVTVTPKLYVACGISGSIYHVLGMRDSETIVAINKDRNAPIFKFSDIGLVGDVQEVIPAMINQLHELSKSAADSDTEVSNAREI